MVQVPVVQVVDVAVVLDGRVAAAFAVLVGVLVVQITHDVAPLRVFVDYTHDRQCDP